MSKRYENCVRKQKPFSTPKTQIRDEDAFMTFLELVSFLLSEQKEIPSSRLNLRDFPETTDGGAGGSGGGST